MPSIDTLVQSEARKPARKGRLIDEVFKNFQRQVYPGAPPGQVHDLRVAFFAGAAEIFDLVFMGTSQEDEPTFDDLAFLDSLAGEMRRFEERTKGQVPLDSPLHGARNSEPSPFLPAA